MYQGTGHGQYYNAIFNKSCKEGELVWEEIRAGIVKYVFLEIVYCEIYICSFTIFYHLSFLSQPLHLF